MNDGKGSLEVFLHQLLATPSVVHATALEISNGTKEGCDSLPPIIERANENKHAHLYSQV